MFDDLFDDDHHDHSALAAGMAYAAYRHGQDAQTEQILAGVAAMAAAPATPAPAAAPAPLPSEIRVILDTNDNPANARHVAPIDLDSIEIPKSWDEYVGQEGLKRQMQVLINSSKARGEALPHLLFESGRPGVGKTTIARLIAKMLRPTTTLVEITPPFDNVYTVVNNAEPLLDGDILFIDEIHLLGKRQQFLLKFLEEKVAYLPDGSKIPMNDITVIGATTNPGALEQPILDRFGEQPFFDVYSRAELGRIAVKKAALYDALHIVDPLLAYELAGACRETPRILDHYVKTARDLFYSIGRPPTGAEVLGHLRVEADGLTRKHVYYLTALKKLFRRVSKDYGVEYVAGEHAMGTILRESGRGLWTIENYLIERGYLDRSPRGRRLTDRGVMRADQLIAQGLGPADF